jgi:hypothetical protein
MEQGNIAEQINYLCIERCGNLEADKQMLLEYIQKAIAYIKDGRPNDALTLLQVVTETQVKLDRGLL